MTTPGARGWQVLACLVAVGVGLLARVVLIHTRSLWFDEVLTMDLARRTLPDLFVALGQESNAPVHYLLAKLMLAPLGGPGTLDFVVRYLSLAAFVYSTATGHLTLSPTNGGLKFYLNFSESRSIQ